MAEQKQLGGQGALSINLVSPAGPIANTRVGGIRAPGEAGEFEVLPGHVPFLTKLHAGVLAFDEAGRKRVFAVGPGILEVGADGAVEVLVEQAVASEKVDVEKARAEIDATQPTLKDWKEELNAEYRSLKARYDGARAQVDARRATP